MQHRRSQEIYGKKEGHKSRNKMGANTLCSMKTRSSEAKKRNINSYEPRKTENYPTQTLQKKNRLGHHESGPMRKSHRQVNPSPSRLLMSSKRVFTTKGREGKAS
jgi:hypothetical protein